MVQSEQTKPKRSKADLYKLSDPHKFDEQDEWGDVNPGFVKDDGNYKADLSKRSKRRTNR